jgi:hypothetical protein
MVLLFQNFQIYPTKLLFTLSKFRMSSKFDVHGVGDYPSFGNLLTQFTMEEVFFYAIVFQLYSLLWQCCIANIMCSSFSLVRTSVIFPLVTARR